MTAREVLPMRYECDEGCEEVAVGFHDRLPEGWQEYRVAMYPDVQLEKAYWVRHRCPLARAASRPIAVPPIGIFANRGIPLIV